MSSRTPLFIIIFLVLLLGAAFYFLREQGNSKYNWMESSWRKKDGYSEKSEQPYGTYIAHRLLKSYLPGKKLVDLEKNVADELPSESLSSGDNYIFIGEALFLDSLSTDRLLKFVAAGNTAFISSKTIPFDLMNYIYYTECEDAPWGDYGSFQDSLSSLSLRTPALPDSTVEVFFAIQNQRHRYNFHYIADEVFCDSLPQHPLGYIKGDWVNFAEFPHGKGRFLLHTTPLAFSNFTLLRPETRPYAEGVWSHLSEGTIYWDAASRIPESVGRRRNGSWYNRNLEEEHPLTYILKQKSLAWAWYLLAGTAGLWLLFRAKRRQRIIPVLKPNENSSYEFISTIAHLHFREKNYQSLSEQGMKLFLSHLRDRYGLTAHIHEKTMLPQTDDAFFKKLAVLSEVPEAQARQIFDQYAAVVRFQPTEQMMVDLHLSMEAFLKQAK
ncbi:MAG: DUF4350 domain-containing protein [Saprospiraceae bacterium]|nr:DUF4350 domain-containing protein [Saprospiraceae bacterium]